MLSTRVQHIPETHHYGAEEDVAMRDDASCVCTRSRFARQRVRHAFMSHAHESAEKSEAICTTSRARSDTNEMARYVSRCVATARRGIAIRKSRVYAVRIMRPTYTYTTLSRYGTLWRRKDVTSHARCARRDARVGHDGDAGECARGSARKACDLRRGTRRRTSRITKQR